MTSTTNTNPLLEYLEDGKSYDLDFGDTLTSNNDAHSSKYAYHTIKYDFKPASVAKSEKAELTVGSTQDVSITLPNVEGSVTQSTKYSGSTKPYSLKECLMIIDPQTGKIVLERLSSNVRVKNVRGESRPVGQPIKPTAPTRAVAADSQSDNKKTNKAAPATTSTSKTVQSKPTTTKVTLNAPVKPMPSKRTLSPADDRLSDEESSPDVREQASLLLPNPAPVQAHAMARRTSHTTLEQDLQLSDTSDEEI